MFRAIFTNGKFADCCITCEGRTFKCHKNILAGRSSVFDAMFTHDMEENRSSKVDIQDLDGETVHDMIVYVYSGKVEKIDDKAPGLLSAAEKYDLKVRTGHWEFPRDVSYFNECAGTKTDV